MFTLAIPTEPRWVDLPKGVRVQIKPLDVLVMTSARNAARREIKAMRQERAERIDVGAPTDDLPDLDDLVTYEVMVNMAFARGLARYAITDFDGVGNAAGTEALPFSPTSAEALVLHPDMMEEFLLACMGPEAALATEGNVSATEPAGSTDPVATIATTAPASATPAPAQ
jgi:hypothetical protein